MIRLSRITADSDATGAKPVFGFKLYDTIFIYGFIQLGPKTGSAHVPDASIYSHTFISKSVNFSAMIMTLSFAIIH